MAKSKKVVIDPANTFNQILEEVEGLRENVSKFMEKGVGAACGRARKHAMAIKKLCGQLRSELQETRNAAK